MPHRVSGMGVKMKKLIAGALIVCASIVLVAVAIIRHVNNKQDAEWCHENGYTNYATKDGFCVGHQSWAAITETSKPRNGSELLCPKATIF
jgi:hypothetical protein